MRGIPICTLLRETSTVSLPVNAGSSTGGTRRLDNSGERYFEP